ncbi:hypothetical protein C2869_01895 [Saccharobesus litoralis]|uniref:FlgO domain-containing protein n=2 Tax=Saccharobesus litoralis TaxID=2172099 RepID=A0A2S0VM64_9ALTE|nr:hypothetical protein C2869_01895 [Saccharobesus litoralis]
MFVVSGLLVNLTACAVLFPNSWPVDPPADPQAPVTNDAMPSSPNQRMMQMAVPESSATGHTERSNYTPNNVGGKGKARHKSANSEQPAVIQSDKQFSPIQPVHTRQTAQSAPSTQYTVSPYAQRSQIVPKAPEVTMNYQGGMLLQSTRQNFQQQQSKQALNHEFLAREIRFLVMDLVNGSAASVIMSKPVWVEEFNDLTSSSRRQVSAKSLLREMLVHESRQYGLNVLESVSGNADGLTVKGSFSRLSGGILVNARVITNSGDAVLNTAQRHLPLDLFTGVKNSGYKDGVRIVAPD